MAARGLCMLTSKLQSCCALELFNSRLSSAGVLACYQQTRGPKYYVKPRTNLPQWHIKVRDRKVTENLTEESQKYLEKAVEDYYRASTAESPLKREPWDRSKSKWHPVKTKRVGLVGIKIGVVPQWLKDGRKIICTVIQVMDNHVIRYVPKEKVNNWADRPSNPKKGYVVVGANSGSPFEFSEEYCNMFRYAGVPPKKKLFKFYVTPEAAVQPGTPLNAMHFKVGSLVDCVSRSTDHGFQGVMKRHKFKGMPATHGVTKSHRKGGSTQSGREHGLPKGKRMPGFMGNKYRYLRGVKVMRINTKYNLLYLNTQAIAGPNHSYVRINDTILRNRRQEWKKNNWEQPMPTFFDEDLPDDLPEEIFHEDMFQFTEPSIEYEVEEEKQA